MSIRNIVVPILLMAMSTVWNGCATTEQIKPRPSEEVSSEVAGPSVSERPRLMVVVVFDQLRGDHLRRFRGQLMPAEGGGFARLMASGAYYPQAAHMVFQAMTCPGHANIATGAWPARHGIPVNTWYDSDKGEKVYCVSDPASPLVGVEGKPGSGVSPRNLMGPTIGDAFKNAGIPSKVVGVSIKDRGAIVMAGHRADAAIWFDTKSARWITSAYYGEVPGWIGSENEALAKSLGQVRRWSVEGPGSGLSEPLPEGFVWEAKVGSHEIAATPFGNEITVGAALAAVDGEGLGQDEHTDLLMVSFSSLDKVGHGVGPNGRLFEEMLVDSDRSLARLLNGLAEKVPGGLGSVVVAVTGDHGVAPGPAYLSAHKVPARSIKSKALEEKIEAGLVARFGKIEGGYVLAVKYFQVFLNRRAIEAKKLDQNDVEEVASEILASEEAFYGALTAHDIRARRVPGGLAGVQVLNGWRQDRSGDVVGLSRPFFISGGAAANHVSGYTYDRYVPLIISGFGVREGLYAEAAEVIDIAPTLAFLGGVLPPALSEGRVLSECLDTEALGKVWK